METLELLRGAVYPPGGESYWPAVDKFVTQEASTFEAWLKDQGGVQVRTVPHRDSPRWFLMEEEEPKKTARRIQITLRGDPGLYILALMPGATLVSPDGCRLTLPHVDPEMVRVVELEGGGIGRDPVQPKGNMQGALREVWQEATELAKKEPKAFSFAVPFVERL